MAERSFHAAKPNHFEPANNNSTRHPPASPSTKSLTAFPSASPSRRDSRRTPCPSPRRCSWRGSASASAGPCCCWSWPGWCSCGSSSTWASPSWTWCPASSAASRRSRTPPPCCRRPSRSAPAPWLALEKQRVGRASWGYADMPWKDRRQVFEKSEVAPNSSPSEKRTSEVWPKMILRANFRDRCLGGCRSIVPSSFLMDSKERVFNDLKVLRIRILKSVLGVRRQKSVYDIVRKCGFI